MAIRSKSYSYAMPKKCPQAISAKLDSPRGPAILKSNARKHHVSLHRIGQIMALRQLSADSAYISSR